MKKNLIKNLVLGTVFTLVFSTAALADNGGTKIEKNVDGIKVDLVLNSEKVKTGENELTILLSDDKGQPVDNANVKVTADMTGSDMGGMKMENSKPMAVELKPGHEKGEYEGKVNFSDKGKWKVKTDFTVNNVEKMADFDVDVASSGPNLFVVGGFLGAIVLIIAFAAIMKNKKKTSAA